MAMALLEVTACTQLEVWGQRAEVVSSAQEAPAFLAMEPELLVLAEV